MADMVWSSPHTGSSEAASNIEVLWITESVYVVCWVNAGSTVIEADVYSNATGSQVHLHSQTIVTYGMRDRIQMAKVRDNQWVIAFTDNVGKNTVLLYHFTWTGITITLHGQIGSLANQQTRYPAVCTIEEDKVRVWGRRYDLDNVLYSKEYTYDGTSWTGTGNQSITPRTYADRLRAVNVADGKGLLLWNEDPDNDGMCHGFATNSGGGSDIVAVDGTRYLRYLSLCKLADNRIIAAVWSLNGDDVGNTYAITLEDPIFPLKPTVGAAFEFDDETVFNVNCSRINATHFLIAYEDQDNGSAGKTLYCTVDWDTQIITASDVETFTANDIGGGTAYGIGMDANSEGIVALSYRDNNDSSYLKTILSILIDDNIYFLTGEIEGLLSAKEITHLHALEEMEPLYNSSDLASLYSAEDIGLLSAKEITHLHGVTMLQES